MCSGRLPLMLSDRVVVQYGRCSVKGVSACVRMGANLRNKINLSARERERRTAGDSTDSDSTLMASMASLKVHDIAPIVNEEDDQDSREFIHFRASMRLPIAPCWAADGTQGGQLGQGGMEGVKEVLASWIMR